jgi:hypothetical protein
MFTTLSVKKGAYAAPLSLMVLMMFPLQGLSEEPESAKPEPFATSQLKKASTTIQAISQSDRHLVVQGADGERHVIEAGPAVENFSEVRPGDRVVVSYYEGVVAEVQPKGQGSQGTTTSKSRAPSDALPAGAVSKTIATTVRVDKVDPATNTISFKRPDGIVRKMAVEHPDAKRFMGELKPGDEVQITYREASAVSIEPARG